MGLREEIKALDTIHCVCPPLLVFQDVADVSGLGVDVAGHVDDPLWGENQQLVQEHCAAAFPRRVDDEGGFRAGEFDAFEDGLGFADDEGCVGDVVHDGVFARRVDAVLVDVDADCFLEALAACDGEEAAAAVGVDKVFRGRGFDGGGGVTSGSGDGEVEVFTDVVGELWGMGGEIRL